MITHDKQLRGFSLIEMMVSMAILALITVYLTDMLLRQSRTYTVVDQVTEMQQNTRVVSDILERELRTTGFMTEESGVFCGVDLLAAPDIVVVSDATVFDPTDQSASNMGVDITDADYSGAGIDTFNVADTSLEGTPFYDVDGDNTPDSDFFDVQPPAGAGMPTDQSGGVIVYDSTNPSWGVRCGRIVPGSVTATRIQVDWTFGMPAVIPLPGAIPVPGDLYMLPATVYQVDQPAGIAAPPATSRLLRNGLAIVEDVEDMQVAMWFDLDNDDVQDAGEYLGARTIPVADPLAGVQFRQNERDNRLLREVRVNLMLRTRQQDPNVIANALQPQGQYQNLENRNTPVPVADAFVRRVQTLTVRPRNVGHRINSL